MAKKNGTMLDIPVKFGGVSIGKTTARLGAKFTRETLDLIQADEVFCAHRLTGRVTLGSSDDSPGQKKMIDTDHVLDGVFDCKSLGVTADEIGTGLTFALNDIDVAELAKFSNGTGRIAVMQVAEIPEDAKDDAPELDEKQKPLDLKFDTPWKKVPVDGVFSVSDAKKLKDVGIDTIGEYCKWFAKGKEYRDIPGCGAATQKRLEDRMAEFWKSNPEAAKEVEEPAEA